jgi:hypothetical protein
VILSFYKILTQAEHLSCHGEDLQSWATTNVAAASKCRLLDAVDSSPSTGLGTLATAALGSMSKWFYDTSSNTDMRATRNGSFVREGLGHSNVSYGGTRWRRMFTLFRPSEHNTLRPQENGSCITVCYSSIGLALVCPEFGLSIPMSTVIFYSTRLQWLHCDLGPDR